MVFNPKQLEKLSNLLLSTDDVNSLVAFKMLENQEFPKTLLNEVFVLFKITKNKKVKQKAKTILEQHGSQELVWAMKMRYPLKSNKETMVGATEKTIKKNIINYCHNNELDGIKLAKALYKKTGFGATYLLTATPQDQRKEMLQTFIEGNSFKLNGKALTQFPPEIFDFPNLTSIDLSGNKITSIPKQIEVFQNLEVLNMGNNKLRSIHKNILKLKQLEELNISQNDFTKKFPEIIFELTHLKRLNIISLRSNWVFHEPLPESFFNMKNLEELCLADGLSRTYPNYPQIKKVTGSPIDIDPLNIAYAAYEQGDNCAISYILKYGNSEIKRKILSKFYDSSTKSMTFNQVYLENIPKEITEFDIRKLSIDRCYLGIYYGGGHSIDPEKRIEMDKESTAPLGELVNLEYLSLNNASLSGITDLSKLQKLKVLNLTYNEFMYFPDDFTNIQGLEELYLQRATQYHQFKVTPEKIPDSLRNLTNLKILKIYMPGVPKDGEIMTKILPELLPNCKISQY